jgi:hypothetical protein
MRDCAVGWVEWSHDGRESVHLWLATVADSTPHRPRPSIRQAITWTTAPLEDGSGWLMYDSFPDDFIAKSVQQFWVINDTLLYCGELRNFFSVNDSQPAAVRAPMVLHEGSTDRSLVYCGMKYPVPLPDCKFLQWTMTLGPSNDTLEFRVLLSDPVVHVHVVLERQKDVAVPSLPATAAHTCNLTSSAGPLATAVATTAVTVPQTPATMRKEPRSAPSTRPRNHPTTARIGGTCPFSSFAATAPRDPGDDYPVLSEQGGDDGGGDSNYSFCYVLNRKHDVRLAWDFMNTTTTTAAFVRVQISANVTVGDSVDGSDDAVNAYVAVGFGQQRFPGMVGSDIALGFLGAGGNGSCVQSLFASEYVGAPIASTAVEFRDSSVWQTGDRLHLAVTRNCEEGEWQGVPVCARACVCGCACACACVCMAVDFRRASFACAEVTWQHQRLQDMQEHPRAHIGARLLDLLLAHIHCFAPPPLPARRPRPNPDGPAPCRSAVRLRHLMGDRRHDAGRTRGGSSRSCRRWLRAGRCGIVPWRGAWAPRGQLGGSVDGHAGRNEVQQPIGKTHDVAETSATLKAQSAATCDRWMQCCAVLQRAKCAFNSGRGCVKLFIIIYGHLSKSCP